MTLESQVIAMGFAALFLQFLICVRRNTSERSESVNDRAMLAERGPAAKRESGSQTEKLSFTE